MALFKNKKLFPKYPKASSFQDMPKYEAQHNIKSEFRDKMPALPELDIDDHPKFDMIKSFPENDFNRFETPQNDFKKFTEREASMMDEMTHKPTQMMPTNNIGYNSPIYVKLEDYKEAVKKLHLIRNKISEAENLLSEIMEIKKEEDRQLADWKNQITDVKNKLMEIDRGLFEVN